MVHAAYLIFDMWKWVIVLIANTIIAAPENAAMFVTTQSNAPPKLVTAVSRLAKTLN